ncbi:hypothetical protein [Mycobacterium simulans]|uniref:hypothetical protein n=1 Tax=Mycobacterium simulans TaxID=627089 RepID=UPI001C90B848|nr:hypothetical protein [Mycobacterium simulans]
MPDHRPDVRRRVLLLRFGGIPQLWLRDLTKRWVRWRLSTALGLEAGGGRRPVVVITRFAQFLADISITNHDEYPAHDHTPDPFSTAGRPLTTSLTISKRSCAASSIMTPPR